MNYRSSLLRIKEKKGRYFGRKDVNPLNTRDCQELVYISDKHNEINKFYIKFIKEVFFY